MFFKIGILFAKQLLIALTCNQDYRMTNQPICPFYGKNDDFCDVGCGYISPHDVNMIIRYCSKRYCECAKYQELADRYPLEDILLVAAA
jgi:hypothetical protein